MSFGTSAPSLSYSSASTSFGGEIGTDLTAVAQPIATGDNPYGGGWIFENPFMPGQSVTRALGSGNAVGGQGGMDTKIGGDTSAAKGEQALEMTKAYSVMGATVGLNGMMDALSQGGAERTRRMSALDKEIQAAQSNAAYTASMLNSTPAGHGTSGMTSVQEAMYTLGQHTVPQQQWMGSHGPTDAPAEFMSFDPIDYPFTNIPTGARYDQLLQAKLGLPAASSSTTPTSTSPVNLTHSQPYTRQYDIPQEVPSTWSTPAQTKPVAPPVSAQSLAPPPSLPSSYHRQDPISSLSSQSSPALPLNTAPIPYSRTSSGTSQYPVPGVRAGSNPDPSFVPFYAYQQSDAALFPTATPSNPVVPLTLQTPYLAAQNYLNNRAPAIMDWGYPYPQLQQYQHPTSKAPDGRYPDPAPWFNSQGQDQALSEALSRNYNTSPSHRCPPGISPYAAPPTSATGCYDAQSALFPSDRSASSAFRTAQSSPSYETNPYKSEQRPQYLHDSQQYHSAGSSSTQRSHSFGLPPPSTSPYLWTSINPTQTAPVATASRSSPPIKREAASHSPTHPLVPSSAPLAELDKPKKRRVKSTGSTDVQETKGKSEGALGKRCRDVSNSGSDSHKGGEGALAEDKPEGLVDGQQEGAKKIVIACYTCRAKKLKCDGARPRCHHCARRDEDVCSYDAALKRRGPGRKTKERVSLGSQAGSTKRPGARPKKATKSVEATASLPPVPPIGPVEGYYERGGGYEGSSGAGSGDMAGHEASRQ